MKIYKSEIYDAYYNLSFEEFILKNDSIDENCFLIYQNRNAIIVGSNQNVYEEVNHAFVEKNRAQIVRRISGGGSVYHDLGNINFAFITRGLNVDYQRILSPIVSFLQSIGVHAQFVGRNDLQVDGRKISGNAQYVYKNKVLHHGTLLFDANFDALQEALKVNPQKIESKGIKSIRQRVANIKEFLDDSWHTRRFVQELKAYFTTSSEVSELKIDPDWIEGIAKIREKRASWEWIYGNSPKFSQTHSKKFNGGFLTIKMNVEKGIIKQIKFEGDFMCMRDITNVSKSLEGVKLIKSEVFAELHIIPFEDYFGSISKEEFVQVMFGE